MTNDKKSQMWFTDFVIGTLLFSFMLVIYYLYVTNIQDNDVTALDGLLSDADTISSSTLLQGYPPNWDNTTVQSIGVTKSDQRIDSDKLMRFQDMPYNTTRKLFGTVHDYLIFFTENNGTLINVDGVCAIGTPAVNVTYDISSAYYYDNSGDSFLKSFMADTLRADMYSAESGYPDFDSMVNNIDKYGFVAIEHPLLPTSIFNNNKVAIESFVSNNSLIMLSGEITAGQGKEMLGVKFYKKSGQSVSDRNSTVVTEDDFLSFDVGENIVFKQAYYIENQSDAKNFTEIVRFNQDNAIAVARWDYGNGSAFYFSDFDTDYFSGDFVDKVTESITKWGKFRCDINMSNIEYKNFAKIERSVIYGSKPVKMVFYFWD